MSQTQPDLLPTGQQTEVLRGQRAIERMNELKRTGHVILRMKCLNENGVYEVTWVEDWGITGDGSQPHQQ